MKHRKSIIHSFFLIVGLILIVSHSCNIAAQTSVGLSVDTLELADQKMQTYIDEAKLSCISTLVLKDGKVAHQSTFGLANIEEERAVDEETIFRICSMSKPITAAALMILYDEGKFQLDDPVATHILEFTNTKVWEDGKEVDQVEPFTIRHLLTHTAGFTYGWDKKSHVDSLYAGARKVRESETATLESWMKFIAGVPLKKQPGSKYEYSISIDVAGYLIEVLSGLSFDEFLQKRVFGPLEMDDSGFEVPEEDFGHQERYGDPDFYAVYALYGRTICERF